MRLQDIDAAFEIPIDLVERANHRKLTAEDVRYIRASKRSNNALARRFHVEPRAVRLARRGDTPGRRSDDSSFRRSRPGKRPPQGGRAAASHGVDL